MSFPTRLFLIFAIVFECTACKNELHSLKPGASKEVSIRVTFGGPNFVVAPKDPRGLIEARKVMDGLILSRVKINHFARSLDGTFCLSASDTEREDATFWKTEFTIQELSSRNAEQFAMFLSHPLLSGNPDSVQMWFVCNEKPGKSLRLFQIIAQFRSEGDLKFLAVNTGKPVE